MIEMRKRFVLLSAYETLTAKESFCIKEANFEAIGRVQAKKSKLLGQLEKLTDQDLLTTEERVDFNDRIERLQIEEKENEGLLTLLKKENRTKFKSLSKHVSSVSKIRKAYGSASSPSIPSRALKDKA